MPPEILAGAKADALSDLYSLGVTLYECVAGRRPFAEDEQQKTLAAILSGRYERLHKAVRGLPREFRAIVARCMHKDPRKRFKTAADLRLALELLLARYGARSNPRARLVGFLASRNLISETEALTCIDAGELLETAAGQIHPPRRLWRLAVALAAAGAAGTVGYWLGQQPWLGTGLFP
jgi:serine/threonine protein kinase